MIEVLKKNKLPAIIVVVYLALLILQPDKASTAFGNSLYYLKEMATILPVIFMLTVGIEVLIPKEWIMKSLGKNAGVKGYFLSLLLGSISAGPIYAAFPICKSLLKKGANVGNIVIILSSWAVIKVPMLANEAKFLGSEFMGIRWILTVAAIFVMAYVMNKAIKLEDLPQAEEKTKKGIEINSDYCIGCGLCSKIAPTVYEMDNGKAIVISQKFNKEHKENIEKTVEKCPGNAITFAD